AAEDERPLAARREPGGEDAGEGRAREARVPGALLEAVHLLPRPADEERVVALRARGDARDVAGRAGGAVVHEVAAAVEVEEGDAVEPAGHGDHRHVEAVGGPAEVLAAGGRGGGLEAGAARRRIEEPEGGDVRAAVRLRPEEPRLRAVG